MDLLNYTNHLIYLLIYHYILSLTCMMFTSYYISFIQILLHIISRYGVGSYLLNFIADFFKYNSCKFLFLFTVTYHLNLVFVYFIRNTLCSSVKSYIHGLLIRWAVLCHNRIPKQYRKRRIVQKLKNRNVNRVVPVLKHESPETNVLLRMEKKTAWT